MEEKINKLTAGVINKILSGDDQTKAILFSMPDNWKLLFIVVFFKEDMFYSWSRIFIKLGITDANGLPDKAKGERIRSIYRSYKKKKSLTSFNTD